VKYDIEPPTTLPEMREQYFKIKSFNQETQQSKTQKKLLKAVGLFRKYRVTHTFSFFLSLLVAERES
jgi:hypothetical protein